MLLLLVTEKNIKKKPLKNGETQLLAFDVL